MADRFLHGVEVLNIDDGSRPISTVSTSVIGIVGTAPDADEAAFPLNVPTMIAGSRAKAALLGALATNRPAEGTLPDAIDSIFDQAGAAIIVVRVDVGATEDETMANVLGGVNATTGAYEGVHALLAAENITGFRPRILLAPGWTHQRPDNPNSPGTALANPAVAEMIGIAERLRATIIQDGPSTTDEDAIAVAGDVGSKRVYLVDPKVLKVDSSGEVVEAWASACVAGLIAKSDNERGWWWSPSNQSINGIVGTARAIDFVMGDYNSRANLLNEKNVTTIIRQNGFRLWGNRTLSDDPKWAFLNIVRTADIIADSLQQNHLWAVARGITKNYVEDVREGVNAYLRSLKTAGAILGGECWLNGELNSPDAISSGQVFWDFDFTGVYPGEHLTFRMHLVDNYLSEIF